MASNKEMEEFFDRLAPDWNNNADEYDIREEITRLMGLPEKCIVADVGCGKGVMFEHLLKTNPRKIIGIDLSGQMIRCAEALFKDDRITYMNVDVLAAPLPDLDAAVIFNSYPHFMDKKALAGKLAKHIRKGSAAIIAHSVSRERINGRHKAGMVSTLSVPLDEAAKEAKNFEPYFIPKVLIDNDDMYFIKMLRV